jgi:hypothetical protein
MMNDTCSGVALVLVLSTLTATAEMLYLAVTDGHGQDPATFSSILIHDNTHHIHHVLHCLDVSGS